jgi:PiT family inorganic phosphate transporter
MMTVGGGIMALTPVASWVVVIAQSLVLFLFASVGLEHLFASNGLPTLPLVPVSSSQAVVGAVIGIGMLQGGRNIRWGVLGNISMGWVATPILAAGICFVSLFFLQNVFNQQVYHIVHFRVSEPVIEKLGEQGIDPTPAQPLLGQDFRSERAMMDALEQQAALSYEARYRIAELARISPVRVDWTGFREVRESELLSRGQLSALGSLVGRSFEYPWMLADALAEKDPEWQPLEDTPINKLHNKQLKQRLQYLTSVFAVPPDQASEEAPERSREQGATGAPRPTTELQCVPA